jgi:hypothetical protein
LLYSSIVFLSHWSLCPGQLCGCFLFHINKKISTTGRLFSIKKSILIHFDTRHWRRHVNSYTIQSQAPKTVQHEAALHQFECQTLRRFHENLNPIFLTGNFQKYQNSHVTTQHHQNILFQSVFDHSRTKEDADILLFFGVLEISKTRK